MVKKKRTKAQIGKNNRRKGGEAERYVVNYLIDSGVYAQRISMLESGGILKGDIRFKKYANEGDWIVSQVKNQIAVPEYVYKSMEGYDVMFMRKPRRKWLVVIDLDFFTREFL